MKFTPSVGFSTLLFLGGIQLAQADTVIPATPAPPAAPTAPGPIRIKAGVTAPLADETDVVWRADTGFVDGATIERPGLKIANTKTPSVYQAERYDMREFHWKLSNGKYIVKLHFCETFEDITGPGQRVFSFTVEGHEFKDFDVWQKAGGGLRAYVETVEVGITDGSLDITFRSQIENPEINAIEIIPR